MAIDKVVSASITDSSVTSAKVASGVLQPNFRNIIINGDMSIAQRGTSTSSITSYGYYTVDRFQLAPNTMGTWTMSQSTDVPTGQGFSNSLKIDCTTADASPSAGDNLTISSNFEGQMLQYLKKGTSSAESLTLSFWIKTNKTGTYIAELYDNDNTRTINKSFTVSSADTWEKKEITYAGDTTGAFGNDANNSLGVNFWLGSGTTYTSGTLQTSWGSRVQANRAVGVTNLADSTSNELYLTGVQLEVGTAASDFEFLPVDVNLQRCRRYFQKNDIWLSDGGYNFMKFYYTPMYLLPNMRTSPSLYDSTDWNSDSGDGGTVTTSGTNKVGIAIDQTCPTNVVLKGADHNGSYREIKGRVHINAEL